MLPVSADGTKSRPGGRLRRGSIRLNSQGKIGTMTLSGLVEMVGDGSKPLPFYTLVSIFGAGNVTVLSGAGLAAARELGLPDEG
jgi:hypothetical protein